MHEKFINRMEAGRLLAEKLAKYSDRPDCVVLGLPRGGVPVGYAVAAALVAVLDILMVRRLGARGEPELAMGSITSGGFRVLNVGAGGSTHFGAGRFPASVVREQQELERRERVYRMGHPGHELRGRTVFLVDDGIASGATMRAAIAAVRSQHAYRIIVASPVAARTSYLELREVADEVITLVVPKEFAGLDQFYVDFRRTSDREVIDLLARARHESWLREPIPTSPQAVMV